MRDVHNILFQADGGKLPKTASDIGKPIAQDVPIVADLENVANNLTQAQRRVLHELKQGQPREYALGRTGFSLVAMGLAFVNDLGARHLTDEGHAVLAYLKQPIPTPPAQLANIGDVK